MSKKENISDFTLWPVSAGMPDGLSAPSVLKALPRGSYPWGSRIRAEANELRGSVVVVAKWRFNWKFDGVFIPVKMGEQSIQRRENGSFKLYTDYTIVSDRAIFFYAPKEGEYEFSVAVTYRDVKTSAEQTRNETGLFTTYLPKGELRPRDCRCTAIGITSDGRKPFVQFGNTRAVEPKDRFPGIELIFSSELEHRAHRAGNDGQIGIMQFMQGGMMLFNEDIIQKIDTGSNWYLDNLAGSPDVLYNGEHCEKKIRYSSYGGGVIVKMTDSPIMILPENITRLYISQSFRSYLVYKSNEEGSRWAPLGHVKWNWNVRLSKKENGEWPTSFRDRDIDPDIDSPSFTSKADLVYEISDELPEWTGVTSQLVEEFNKLFP
jgi:hypothetical protein